MGAPSPYITTGVSMEVILRQGGSLTIRRDDQMEEVDRPDLLNTRYLDLPVELEEGVTLLDLFLLIENTGIDRWSDLIGNWVGEYVAEAKQEADDPADLDTLVVRRYLSVELYGGCPPNLSNTIDVSAEKKGEPYGISFISMSNMGHLSINIDKLARLYPNPREPHLYIEVEYSPTITLLELVKAVVWEVSFFGPPEDRDEVYEELEESIIEIEEHPEDLVPMRSVWEALDINEDLWWAQRDHLHREYLTRMRRLLS